MKLQPSYLLLYLHPFSRPVSTSVIPAYDNVSQHQWGDTYCFAASEGPAANLCSPVITEWIYALWINTAIWSIDGHCFWVSNLHNVLVYYDSKQKKFNPSFYLIRYIVHNLTVLLLIHSKTMYFIYQWRTIT